MEKDNGKRNRDIKNYENCRETIIKKEGSQEGSKGESRPLVKGGFMKMENIGGMKIIGLKDFRNNVSDIIFKVINNFQVVLTGNVKKGGPTVSIISTDLLEDILEKYYNSYPYKIYEEKTNNIFIKEFNNLYSEVEQVAKEIVNLVRDKGVRYRDITVATRDLNKYDFLVRSIFNEYKIPNFIDKKREAKANPIIVLIISALEMKNTPYNKEENLLGDNFPTNDNPIGDRQSSPIVWIKYNRISHLTANIPVLPRSFTLLAIMK